MLRLRRSCGFPALSAPYLTPGICPAAEPHVLWPAEQGLVGPAVASCPEVLRLFTAAAPLKLPCASGHLPAEDLQDVGLKYFISGSQAVVPVTETVNQKAPTLYCNACVRACVFVF